MKRRVLVCAGLDPSGRAGLLADFEAVSALGAEGVGVATALTAQGGPHFLLRPISASVIREQLAALHELGPIHSVKLGMVPDRRVLEAIWDALEDFSGWRIVDPVTRTSRGERLSTLSARDYLRLAHPKTVLTPNLPELEWLAGKADDAEALLKRGFGAVVVKGGHADGAPTDWVITSREAIPLRGRRVRSSRRGTGCRFASALAAGLARGQGLVAAARAAKELVASYLR